MRSQDRVGSGRGGPTAPLFLGTDIGTCIVALCSAMIAHSGVLVLVGRVAVPNVTHVLQWDHCVFIVKIPFSDRC